MKLHNIIQAKLKFKLHLTHRFFCTYELQYTHWFFWAKTDSACMVYCCHVWAGGPSCYLELLDKLQKQICKTVGSSIAASLEPLTHHQNVASYIGVTLVGVHLNWLNWFYFLICKGSILSPFLDVTRISMPTVFFLAQLDSEIPCQ